MNAASPPAPPTTTGTSCSLEKPAARCIPNSLVLRFRRLTERAGVPAIRFHDIRHTCATLMLANGEHPKVVQERLGHADIAMTMNLYSHVAANMQRTAAERRDAAIEAARRPA